MFNETDLKLYRLFKHHVGSADIKLEGKAVCAAALAFRWFDELEKKIESDVNKKETSPAPVFEEIEDGSR